MLHNKHGILGRKLDKHSCRFGGITHDSHGPSGLGAGVFHHFHVTRTRTHTPFVGEATERGVGEVIAKQADAPVLPPTL